MIQEALAAVRHPCDLVIDDTNFAVGDICKERGLKPIRICFTSGAEATRIKYRKYGVPKSLIVGNIDARLHCGELHFAKDLTESEALKDEFANFQRHLSAASRNAIFEARSGKHDDIIMAIGCALWWAIEQPFAGQPSPPPLIGYMRVSKADGSQVLDLQKDALLSAGVSERHLYSDTASGKKDDRPGLGACLQALRRGDTPVVWKLDRLGRSLRHLVNVVHDLTSLGIGLRVLTGQGAAIDTTTPAGKLVFGIFASLAEFERDLISERTRAGLASARARGRKGGRRPKMTSSQATGLQWLPWACNGCHGQA
jgi:Resolvase, N terminal domain